MKLRSFKGSKRGTLALAEMSCNLVVVSETERKSCRLGDIMGGMTHVLSPWDLTEKSVSMSSSTGPLINMSLPQYS